MLSVPRAWPSSTTGRLTYGQLDDGVRRLAAGLRSLGVRREERVLILMHDGNHWPVSFLGALYAGVVPSRSTRCCHPTTTPTCSSIRARKPSWCRASCFRAEGRA
jgi:acyl-coenzyme A synthetase/AMP-(fatty) acid ligase